MGAFEIIYIAISIVIVILYCFCVIQLYRNYRKELDKTTDELIETQHALFNFIKEAYTENEKH